MWCLHTGLMLGPSLGGWQVSESITGVGKGKIESETVVRNMTDW